jgi:hypothetical protein
LIAHGAVCVSSKNLLLRAVESGGLDTVKALIEARADINRADNDGQTALDLAQKPSLKKGGLAFFNSFRSKIQFSIATYIFLFYQG